MNNDLDRHRFPRSRSLVITPAGTEHPVQPSFALMEGPSDSNEYCPRSPSGLSYSASILERANLMRVHISPSTD
jgi:hypothetical protein